MGLHYTVNNSTNKKFLALASSFWRGLRNFGYVFCYFLYTPTSVKKCLTLCDGGVRTRTAAVLVLLSQLVV